MDFEGVAGDMVSHLPGKTGFNVSHMTNTAWATAINLAEHIDSDPYVTVDVMVLKSAAALFDCDLMKA